METIDSLPPSLEWKVYKNDTAVLTLALVDARENDLDIEGWEFTGQVRQFPSNEEIENALTITKNENYLTVYLNSSNLDVVNFFDIQATNEELNKISTIVSGRIFVQEDVTQ